MAVEILLVQDLMLATSNHNGSPSVFGPLEQHGGLVVVAVSAGDHGTTAVIQDGAPGGSGGGAGYLGPSGGGSGSGSAGNGNDPSTSPAQGFDGGPGQGGGGGGATGPSAGAGPNGAGGAGSPIAIETNSAKTYSTGGFGGNQDNDEHGGANALEMEEMWTLMPAKCWWFWYCCSSLSNRNNKHSKSIWWCY